MNPANERALRAHIKKRELLDKKPKDWLVGYERGLRQVIQREEQKNPKWKFPL